MWYELKKKARVNQYRQIQNINFCNKTLKEEYCLTSEGIHDRLSRSSVCKKNPFLLTKFKEIGNGFEEIVLAISNSNILATGGNIKTSKEEFLIRANNKKYYSNEIQNIIIRADNNGKILCYTFLMV